MPEKNEQDKSYVTTDGTVDLSIFLKMVIQRAMGKALDYARISGMADRSLTQFERSIKDDYYRIIDDGTKILKEFGYIKDDK